MTSLKHIEIKRTWFIYRDKPTQWRNGSLGATGASPAPAPIEARAREMLDASIFARENYAIAHEMEDGTWMIEVDDEWLGALYRLEG